MVRVLWIYIYMVILWLDGYRDRYSKTKNKEYCSVYIKHTKTQNTSICSKHDLHPIQMRI